MIKPQDIANDRLLSGYDHVGFDRTPGTKKPYHAQVYGGKNNKAGHQWQGPPRGAAIEAAQDYCDYVNGNNVVVPAKLISAGHKASRDPMNDDEVKAARGVLRDHRAQRRGRQGYVYCISDGTALKVGYSVKPEARVGELQTGNPRMLVLLGFKKGTEEDEAALHLKYIDDNLLAEWFRPTRPLLSEFGLTFKTDPRLAWMARSRRAA